MSNAGSAVGVADAKVAAAIGPGAMAHRPRHSLLQQVLTTGGATRLVDRMENPTADKVLDRMKAFDSKGAPV